MLSIDFSEKTNYLPLTNSGTIKYKHIYEEAQDMLKSYVCTPGLQLNCMQRLGVIDFSLAMFTASHPQPRLPEKRGSPIQSGLF